MRIIAELVCMALKTPYLTSLLVYVVQILECMLAEP